MILEILAIVLLILFAFIAMILFIPFRVLVSGSMTLTASNFELRFSWLGITLWRSKSVDREKKATPRSKTKTRRRPLQILSLVWKSHSVIENLLNSFRRAIRIDRLSADLSFGTGDPADTAVFAGYMWSLVSLLDGSFPALSLSVKPDLENVSLDGTLDGEAAIRVVFVVAGFLRAYSHRSFRQLIKEVRAP
jgi:hypothetical protein